MAIITGTIPEQGFEKVLYQIGAILFDELTEQKDTYSNMVDFNVFIDRIVPFDKSENLMINVTPNTINYSGHNELDMQGSTNFNIEVYSPLELTEVLGNDQVSKITIHKVVGMIRYILSSTKYNRLSLPNGLIGGTYVESVSFFDDYNNQDGANIRVSTIGFNVRINENSQLWQGVQLQGSDTIMKLYDTEKGYKLIKNN